MTTMNTAAPVRLAPETDDVAIPLVIDIDGTLIRSDLLVEGMVHLLLRRPILLLQALGKLASGRAAFKHAIAHAAALDTSGLPIVPEVVTLIEGAQKEGRHVVLASGCCEAQATAIGLRLGVPTVIASTPERNLTGKAKLAVLRERFGTFDYVGNATVDLSLWQAARRSYAVNTTARCRAALHRIRPDFVELARRPGLMREMVRAMRPHQWAKNVLLFLPGLAGHIMPTPVIVGMWILGFVAFSSCASAIYLINDMVDLPHDRRHDTKRHRPLTSGALPLGVGLGEATVLLGIALIAAIGLPGEFQVALGFYAVLSLSYSLVLKGRLLIDILTLASLYTVRVVAGGALVGVTLSRWFIAFSLFLFFALAVAKRVSELRAQSGDPRSNGRSYEPIDQYALLALGTSATAAACLVYCLYITSGFAINLYTRPDLLWCGLPLLLYWQSRIWIFAFRATLTEDPVAFALHDRTSYLTAGAFFLTVLAAV